MQKCWLLVDKCIVHLKNSVIRRRAALTTIPIAAGITLVVGYHLASAQQSLDAYKFGRNAQQGKAIAPVPLNLDGKNPELVYLGSYLVNGQGGCNSCHTCPSYKGVDPHQTGGNGIGPPASPGPVNTANYLAGGTPLPAAAAGAPGAPVAATNLTPDASGLPGGMTYDQFKNAMQNGVDSRNPAHILQAMPWPVYRKMYENDLVAIYQYLSAVPPATPGGKCTGPGQTGP